MVSAQRIGIERYCLARKAARTSSFKWLESDRLESCLEELGQAAGIEVHGAEERVAGLVPVEVGGHRLGRVGSTALSLRASSALHDRPSAGEQIELAGEIGFSYLMSIGQPAEILII